MGGRSEVGVRLARPTSTCRSSAGGTDASGHSRACKPRGTRVHACLGAGHPHGHSRVHACLGARTLAGSSRAIIARISSMRALRVASGSRCAFSSICRFSAASRASLPSRSSRTRSASSAASRASRSASALSARSLATRSRSASSVASLRCSSYTAVSSAGASGARAARARYASTVLLATSSMTLTSARVAACACAGRGWHG